MNWPAADLEVGAGRLSLSPLPGRGGDLAGDLAALAGWRPDLVVSLTETAEMARHGAAGLPAALAGRGIGWLHLPVADFGVPQTALPLAGLAARLAQGQRIALHCLGGCGRSGMLALRLMVLAGEAPETALARLRAARPCAVETAAQLAWAFSPE